MTHTIIALPLLLVNLFPDLQVPFLDPSYVRSPLGTSFPSLNCMVVRMRLKSYVTYSATARERSCKCRRQNKSEGHPRSGSRRNYIWDDIQTILAAYCLLRGTCPLSSLTLWLLSVITLIYLQSFKYIFINHHFNCNCSPSRSVVMIFID